MGEIAGIGVGEVVVSWWGRGSQEDQRLPMLIRAASRRGLEVGAHLEPYTGRTIESVTGDVEYLRGLGIRDVYLYDPFLLPDDGLAALNATLTDVRMLAQTKAVERAARDGFDGVYTYDVLEAHGFNALCSAARAAHIACAPSVGPGFDARRAAGIPRVRPRRDGATYDHLWRMALRARPDMITITSYNEWHEGTQIEAARGKQFFGGRRYGTYDGAWGLHGAAASNAYLQRTAWWLGQFG
jgi:glycoprotein endo-alpha-1,2-mannosidase